MEWAYAALVSRKATESHHIFSTQKKKCQPSVRFRDLHTHPFFWHCPEPELLHESLSSFCFSQQFGLCLFSDQTNSLAFDVASMKSFSALLSHSLCQLSDFSWLKNLSVLLCVPRSNVFFEVLATSRLLVASSCPAHFPPVFFTASSSQIFRIRLSPRHIVAMAFHEHYLELLVRQPKEKLLVLFQGFLRSSFVK